MTEQGKLLPAEGVGHPENFRYVVPYLVGRIQRAAVAAAMAGEVQGDHITAVEQGRQHTETCRIIEPAMEG